MSAESSYAGPGELWAPDDEPRQCRRWNKKHKRWQWKVRFETREAAVDGPGKGSVVYVCTDCGFWHRASIPPSQRTFDSRNYDPRKLPCPPSN